MRNTERDIAHLWIPMADGRRLAARLWLPEQAKPAPAILEYLPYRKRDGTASRDATTHPVFAEQGYACIRVDIGGSGESDGLHDDEYSERELADGETVLAWIAEQDWCNGKIGMIGVSWGGFNGLQLAFRRPPELKAVVSVCSTVDRYADDIHFMGGCLLTDNFNWGAQMTAYMTRPPDPALREDWRARWLERIDELPFYAAEWLKHPTRDRFWRHGSVCETWNAIDAAVLAIGGWADAYVNAPPALAENLSAPCKALIGPWEHKFPHIARIEPADFHGEVLRWFDHWLRGEKNGADELPAYRAYIQEHDEPSPLYGPRAGRWVGERAWPSPHVDMRTLHLTKRGLRDADGAGTRTVSSSFHIGMNAAYFCPGMRIDNELAGNQADDDALSVCFDSEVLSKPLELLGRPEVAIDFSVDRPVGQLCFRLCDVDPHGVSQRVSYRVFNLTHHNSHASPEALEPGKRYTALVPLNECGHRFHSGHRVRLAVSTSYWPVVWPAPEAATVTLHLEGCSLYLPMRNPLGEIESQAPGAPRKFPTLDAEVLHPPSSHTDRFIDGDGMHVLETFDDFGTTRDPEHGLEVGSEVTQRYVIHPRKPLTARHEARWEYSFRRGGWAVSIESENVMTATADQFRLWRRVAAHEGGKLVKEREWEETIPRNLL